VRRLGFRRILPQPLIDHLRERCPPRRSVMRGIRYRHPAAALGVSLSVGSVSIVGKRPMEEFVALPETRPRVAPILGRKTTEHE
jgi:hypothetical protein